MKNIIIGTAGHVDHGKTCLIKALTGTDTDRLKEEKKRGITIELGFANMEATKDCRIGIIDVPGHEKFVKNMLAGIGGIDLVLFVVALDEGIMPQSREHFEIIKALGIKKGILVFTKKDMVEPDWADMVIEDTREMVKGSFLEDAPYLQVSAYTGENIEELKQMILSMVKEEGNRREEAELFRLPIDRVFTMEGFGTVVTGTLLEGSLKEGDEVMIYPGEKKVKVRGIQNHNSGAKEAFAGQRTAINLAGIKKEELNRGEVLARVDSMVPTSRMDVTVKLFDDTARRLKNHDRVHISYGSAQTMCKVVLLGEEYLTAGQESFAQLIFDEPVAMRHGDKFILRFISPVESFAGGRVLEPDARKHKGKEFPSLTLLQSDAIEEQVEGAMLNRFGNITTVKDLAKVLCFTKAELENTLEKLKKSKKIFAIHGTGFVSKSYWEMVVEKSTKLLEEFHVTNPIAQGMEKQEFKSRLGQLLHLKEEQPEDILFELVKRGLVKAVENQIALVEFESSYTGSLAEMNQTIIKIYENAGKNALTTEEVISGFKDKKMAKQIVNNLLKDEIIVRLSPAVYIEKSAYEEALALLKEAIGNSETGTITLSEYRDLLETSRKYAVQLLEAFDTKGITKMQGEARVLVKG